MESVESDIKKVCLFDPQFYVPDSQKTKLQTYEFFPEKITDGFSTTDFESVAHEAAELCLDFQLENEYQSIIIPARYYPDLVTDYIEKQKTFTVEPFLNEIERKKVTKDVFVSLPVTVKMTQDKGYRTELLNWITSYPEIDGVYLLNQIGELTKQISTFEKLEAHVNFVHDMKEAGLKVIVGYCNTESVVLSGLEPYALTFGAYENTRTFSIDKFLEDDSEKRGPAPRIYFPKLLNWIRYDTAKEIKEDFANIWDKIYTATDHMEKIFASSERPHFTKPELYKHHFVLISKQLEELASLEKIERIRTIKEILEEASALYKEIEDVGVMFFDGNCKGEHLPAWNRVLRKIEQLDK